MSSYPPHFFSSPSSSSQSSSNTTPFMRNPYPTSYHPVHPPPIYYPFPPFDGSVNMNNPYIYDPTHVKHRRRTTPEQLKVLEETFKTDPKPNPALRKKLALELSMTPRVLQVWFQNRRMKSKRLVKKQCSSFDQPLTELVSNDSLGEQQRSENAPSSPTFSSNTAVPAIATGSVISTAPAPASASTPIPSGSPSPSPAPSPPYSLSYPDLTLRRSSLPPTVGFNSSPNHHLSFHNFHQQQQQSLNHYQHHGMSWNNTNNNNSSNNSATHHDVISNSCVDGNDSVFNALPDPLLLRRRSFTSLHRLETHPFAPLVAAGNGVAISLHTRQNQSHFPLLSEPASASSTSPEPRIGVNPCASSSDSSIANNTPNAPVALSPFPPIVAPSLPDTKVNSIAAGAPLDPAEVSGGSTSSESEGLNSRDIVQQESHRSSSADDSGILRSGITAKSGLTDNLRPTLKSSVSEEIHSRSNDQGSHSGPSIPPHAHRHGSSLASLQQPTSFLQRSQSTSQVRPFAMHHHSSSTPPLVFTHGTQQGPGFGLAAGSVTSHMANNLTHSHMHTPMGIIQPGCRSASFHGIRPNTDNYQTYYNRQMSVGQDIFMGKARGVAGQKRFDIGYGRQQPMIETSVGGLHSAFAASQHQIIESTNRNHVGSRSVSSTSLLDHPTSQPTLEINSHLPCPYQSSHPQFRQMEMEFNPPEPPYAFPPRPLGASLPGPLPAAGYSFGTATSSNADSEMLEKEGVQDNKQPSPPTWDATSTNNIHNSVGSAANINEYDDIQKGYQTRFSSLASLASVPSASEGGTTAEWDWDWEFEGLRGGDRRGSCTGQVAELFSNLEVGSRRGSEESIYSLQSGHSLDALDGMLHKNHPCDPSEIQEVSYAIPDVDLQQDSGVNISGNKNEVVNSMIRLHDENSTKKGDESIGPGDDEDQRKTPSASPAAGRNTSSEGSKEALYQQTMDISGKNIHGNQIISYSQFRSEPSHCTPVHDFYNSGIIAEYSIPEFDVSSDSHQGSMGMNIDIGTGMGEPFRYQVDYMSHGVDKPRSNGDDNMHGVEHYTSTAEGPYNGVY